MLQKWSCKFHSNCQNTLWTPINCHLRFVTLNRARKNRPKSFLHWKECFFFQSIYYQQPLSFYRNDLVNSPVIVKILSDPFNLPLWSVTLDNARKKKGQNIFFTGQVDFFFKNLCFQQPISHRNDLITSTVKVKLRFGPLQVVPWGLSQSITGEKKKPTFFSSIERLPFFKKFVFPSSS